MKKWVLVLAVIGIGAVLISCGGNGSEAGSAQDLVQKVQELSIPWGTGWFVHLFLIVVPLLVILVKLFRESEATSDSLISLEGQLRRLNNKIDDLEASIKGEKK